jgi:chemotaxis protein CheC
MNSLNVHQLESLASSIGAGASQASQALSTWLGRNVQVLVEQLEQVSLEAATEQLGQAEKVACACCMQVTGKLGGQLLLGFDDASGLMLCDILLARETQSDTWGELETSAATETTNIIGCAFLRSIADAFPVDPPSEQEQSGNAKPTWAPSPPVFVRDYAASIMQSVLMDQASEFDPVLVAQTTFSIDGMPINWRLLLIPDAEMLRTLARTLP